MSTDEVAARLIVLEVFSTTALGLYLANSRNDPDYEKARAFLEDLKSAVQQHAERLPEKAQIGAKLYAQQLVDNLSSSVRDLRGEGGQSH